jgi:hypothetical protein
MNNAASFMPAYICKRAEDAMDKALEDVKNLRDRKGSSPPPPADPTYMLCIPQADIDGLMKRLTKRKSTSIRFNGDDYITQFHLRNGVLYTFNEPEHKEGRIVTSAETLHSQGPLVSYSLKGLLILHLNAFSDMKDGCFANDFLKICRESELTNIQTARACAGLLGAVNFAKACGWEMYGDPLHLGISSDKEVNEKEKQMFTILYRAAMELATEKPCSANAEAEEEDVVDEDPK